MAVGRPQSCNQFCTLCWRITRAATNQTWFEEAKTRASFALEFEHEGKLYSVKRVLRRAGSPTASLSVKKGSQWIELAPTQKSVNSEIETLIRLGKTAFENLVYVRQGEIAKIISLEDQERKALFDRLLGIDDYERAWQNSRYVITELEHAVGISQQTMDQTRLDAESLKERLAELRKKKTEARLSREELKRLQDDLNDARRNLGVLDQLNEKLVAAKESIHQKEVNLRRDLKHATDLLAALEKLSTTTGIEMIDDTAALARDARKKKQQTAGRVSVLTNERDRLLKEIQSLKKDQDSERKLRVEIDKLDQKAESTKGLLFTLIPSTKKAPRSSWTAIVEAALIEATGQESDCHSRIEAAQASQVQVDKIRARLDDFERQKTASEKEERDYEARALKIGGSKWKQFSSGDVVALRSRVTAAVNSRKGVQETLEAAQRVLTQAEHKEQGIGESIAELKSLSGKKCPTCKQPVPVEHVGPMLSDLSRKLAEARSAANDARNQQAEAEGTLKKITSEENEAREKLDMAQQLSPIAEFIQNLSQKISGLLERIGGEKEALAKAERKTGRENLETLNDEWTRWKNPAAGLQQARALVNPALDSLTALEEKRKDLASLTASLMKRIGEGFQGQLTECDEQLEFHRSMSGYLQEMEHTADDLAMLRGTVVAAEKDLTTTRNDLENLEAEFSTKDHSKAKRTASQLEQKTGVAKQKAESMLQETVPRLEQDVDRCRRAKESYDKADKDNSRAQSALLVMEKVRDFFRAIQPSLRQNDNARVSKHATELFRNLMGTNEYDSLRITDNHDLQVSRSGVLESLDNLSGGEQVLAALSVRLGFARALAGSDLLMLDEPTSHLDDTRRAQLVDVLDFLQPAKQLLIVTHDEDFESVADTLIRVRKNPSTMTSEVEVIGTSAIRRLRRHTRPSSPTTSYETPLLPFS